MSDSDDFESESVDAVDDGGADAGAAEEDEDDELNADFLPPDAAQVALMNLQAVVVPPVAEVVEDDPMEDALEPVLDDSAEDFANVPVDVPVPPGTPLLLTHLESIVDRNIPLDRVLAAQVANELNERWLCFPRTFQSSKILDCAFALYGFKFGDLLNETVLHQKETEYLDNVMQLYSRFVYEKWVEPNNSESVAGQRFVRILEIINNTALQIRLFVRSLNLINPGVSVAAATLHKWRLRMDDSEKEPSSYQHLLMFILAGVYEKNMRKYNGRLYKQVVISIPGTPNYRTHAWEMQSEIQDFIFSSVNRYTHYDMWLHMTASHNNVTSSVNYLKNCRDFEIPILEPNRHVFSFKNCIYDAVYNKVYKYGDEANPVPLMLVSSKFFDIDFPMEMNDPAISFRDIPTPKLDHILNHQKVSDEPHVVPGHISFSVKDWFYVFIGRMMYEIGEFDDWQCLMFIKGIAGSGKSTIGKLISYLYDASDVGVLSNNTEKKFGLSALVDKKIYICYEVKSDFTLDQGEFQSMVSGEQMSIPVKFSTASSVWWKSHGIFMGNEIAGWADNSGSMSRRIVLAVFNQRVIDSNPRLYAELQEEMGAIILKCNRAYREAAAEFGRMDIWKALPNYFIVNRRKFRAETHALASFLENSKAIIKNADYCVTLDELSNLMRIYVQNDPSGAFKHRTKQFNEDFYMWVLDDYGLKLKLESRIYKGAPRFEKFVDGIGDAGSPEKILYPVDGDEEAQEAVAV